MFGLRFASQDDDVAATPPPVALESPYEVRGRERILAVLDAIRRHRALVTVQPVGRASGFVSALLHADDAGLVLDAAASDEDNRRVLAAPASRVEGRDGEVRVLFAIGAPRPVTFEGRPALFVPLPVSLLRFQRREHYRIHVPLARPVLCSVAEDEAGRVVPARVLDLSCGGLSLAGDAGTADWRAGELRDSCRLRFPTRTPIAVRLEVVRTFRERGRAHPSVGCRFVRLTPAELKVVQLYVDEVQRDLRRRT